MTKEDKELLLKDLCARLPYNVVVRVESDDTVFAIRLNQNNISEFSNDKYELTPYLRPMSSMTEEEEKEYINIDNLLYSCPMDYAHIPASDRIDWLNANHFDYRGLIKKGLALEYTKDCDSFKFDNSI